MLTILQVRDFAIVDEIAVEFEPGMTVLTGETGAGKSILVDAVGLVLGERGSSQLVRSGAKRAEFSAEFNIAALPQAANWLEEQELDQDDVCLLRRIISADGRSRAFINGNAVTMQQLKALGELLLDIHGQHFHQSLGRRPIQRDLLDHYGKLLDKRRATEVAFEQWKSLRDRYESLLAADTDRASRLDLVEFQLSELDALGVEDGELGELQAERQKLLHSSKLAEGVSAALNSLGHSDAGNAASLISEAMHTIEPLVAYDEALEAVRELLESASIQVSEACETLQRYGDGIDMDPARRDWVEERLDALQTMARKHRTTVEDIPALTERLRHEHHELTHAEEMGHELETQTAAARDAYFKTALSLSSARKKAAASFCEAITEAMDGLGMPGGKFDIRFEVLTEDDARSWGIDNIEFLISANPGQEPMPLSKVASGGELSRMSLAVQVIASDGSSIPTMIFDEVDSGVGGGVAEMVGRRLQQLGANRQVLCVTHLPQVASLAAHHLRISKVTDGKATRTGVSVLGNEERIEEIARMLGGVEITKKTLDHAAEMLAGADRKRA
jgi:DNA repair protein RecN (Recombination protein N)